MSSANQKTETESWLLQDKHYENEKMWGTHQCFQLPLPEKLACHLQWGRMKLAWRAMLQLDWPGILAWSVEISGLGKKHLKMSQGQPAVWCPSPGPRLSPKILSSFVLLGGPEAIKGKGSLRL